GIAKDQKGNLWLSSNRGIFSFNPDSTNDKVKYHFTYRDGLSSNEYSRGAALCSSTGHLWFGSTKGIDVFHPDSLKEIYNPPKLLLSELRIHDKPWQGDTVIHYKRNLRLKPYENSLAFRLAAPEYTDPERTTFKVYLQYEGEYIDSTDLETKNTVNYANLAPGDYVFSFTATSANGVPAEEPYSFSFCILPYYYQTLWFRSLVGAAIAGFIFFGTRFYYRNKLNVKKAQLKAELERQQREVERERLIRDKERSLEQQRKRISDELHDDLGTELSTLKRIGFKLDRIKETEEVTTYSHRIRGIAQDLDQNLRDIFWATNQEMDSLADLIARLRHNTSKALTDNDLSFTIDSPHDFIDRPTGSTVRHNVLRMLKEIINNILKHAKATHLDLAITAKHDWLILRVKDNGKGFTPEINGGRRGGNGLNSLRSRAAELNGCIHWELAPEGGTITTVRVPLPKVETNSLIVDSG
ncbi:MAG: ATP-binding protein, partial [Bacteroidota bacterium]